MIPYSPVQLFFFFYFYCFCGWIIECTYVSVRTRKITNRGFMIGPFIPIYGFGAMTMLLACTPVIKYPVLVFFVGMISASVLEYFTGMAMEAIFKVRYWDYSNKKFNINGHVCLLNSTYWGGISVLLLYVLHKPIEKLAFSMDEKTINITVMVISLYFAVDLTMSFKAAFDIRRVLIMIDKSKEEMRIMQKRLDVMLAYANESMTEQKDKLGDKVNEISESLEAKFVKVREMLETKPSEFAGGVKEEYYELRDKFSGFKANKFGLTNFSDFYKRAIIKGNPDMVSKKYKDSLETVKNYVNKKEK